MIETNIKTLREVCLKPPDTQTFGTIMLSLEDDREVRRVIEVGIRHIMADTIAKGGTLHDVIRKFFYIGLERGIAYKTIEKVKDTTT